jgi:hypothetical protein
MAGIARGEPEENYTTLGNLLSLCPSLEMASCLRAIAAIKAKRPSLAFAVRCGLVRGGTRGVRHRVVGGARVICGKTLRYDFAA